MRAGGLPVMRTSAATPKSAVRPSSSRQAFAVLGCPGPRHELVETRGRPEIDQPGQHVAEIGLRIDAMELAGLDERSDAGPVLRALIVARKQRVLAIEHERPDAALDDVGVELDAALVEEAGEPAPMIERVADVLGHACLARDSRHRP